MKEQERWNTFFATERGIPYASHLQTVKELSKRRLDTAATRNRASLSFGSLIIKQLRFLAWKIWLLQGMVLAALCAAFLCLYKDPVLNLFFSTLPEFLCLCGGMIVLSAVPLLHRSSRYRMMELEQSTRFSIAGSLSAQLIFIGIGDLAMLAALAIIVWQHGLTGSVIFLSLVIPFLTAAATCLMLWVRTVPSTFERQAVLLCMTTTLLMNRVIDWYKDSRQDSGLWFWFLYASVCLTVICHEYRKLCSGSYNERMS